jgi:hypothetical protein
MKKSLIKFSLLNEKEKLDLIQEISLVYKFLYGEDFYNQSELKAKFDFYIKNKSPDIYIDEVIKYMRSRKNFFVSFNSLIKNKNIWK